MTPEETVAKFKQEQREVFYKHSDELMRTYGAYDKTVLTLSSGAVGLCLLLLKEPNKGASICTLKIAMLMFGLSLVSVLLSYFFGILSFKEAMKMALRLADLKEYQNAERISRLQYGADSCNLISGATFITGVILITLFIFCAYG